MYTTSWYLPDQVILVKLAGDLKVEELVELNQEIVKDYLNPAQHMLHIIVDGSDVGSLPNNIYGITKAAKPLASHKRVGGVIYVQFGNSIFDFLANVATQILGHSHKTVQSMNEVDAALSDLGVEIN